MTQPRKRKLAILVGGGPAPGINSVIAAATIRAEIDGIEVVGIRDGFESIMQGDVDHVIPLTIDRVSRIHFRGGSHLGISRANPTRNPQHLENAVLSLLKMNVSQLITIGGDDTAYSAMKLEEQSAGRLRVVHVPKSIDNDLDLPAYVDTFGFQTARHYGVDIVKNLMVDAKTTSRWYFAIAMGRKAGHLALGIGKAAGATLTLIPEEFADGPVRLRNIADTLAGAIIKRLADNRKDGVAVIAEGLVLSLTPEDLAELDSAERDAHGHIRIEEINIGEILKDHVLDRLRSSASRRQSSPRISVTSCAAPIRSRTTWSTRAISGTARPSICSPVATASWSPCRRDISSRFPSASCSIRQPASRACGWWTFTRPGTASHVAT